MKIVVSQIKTREPVFIPGLGQLQQKIDSRENLVYMEYTEMGVLVKGAGHKKGFGIVPLSNVLYAHIDVDSSEM
jgi:hypothetical protein